MKIEEMLDYLRRKHPKFGRKVMYDMEQKGNEFCEIIYPNEMQPLFPVTVAVSEAGCLISVGQFSNVTGDFPIPCEAAAEAIADIVEDRIVFVLGYNEEDDIGFGTPFFKRLYPFTGGEDDCSREYEKLLQKLSTPVTGFKRKLTSLKGRFLIFNFSGSINQTIFR